ncbi:hypothetical protein RQP46_005941 [Phenoliferia psychrophenolica]
MNTPQEATDDPKSGRVPPEILYEILDNLPARDLVPIRLASRTFADTVNALLRTRLLHIVKDPTQELVFQSNRPADYRKTPGQKINFIDFVQPEGVTCGTEIARFSLPSSPAPVSQFLPMEDDEAFGTFILSVHIRGVEPPPTPEEELPSGSSHPIDFLSLATPPLTPASSPVRLTPLHWALNSAIGTPPRFNLPATPASTPPRGPPSVSLSLSLAEGTERLYRTWFENPLAQPPSTTTLECPRKTLPHTLSPTGSALKAARIQCRQVLPSEPFEYPSNRYGSQTYIPTRPSLFEFAYESVELDVAMLISAVEEGLDSEESHGPVILWML